MLRFLLYTTLASLPEYCDTPWPQLFMDAMYLGKRQKELEFDAIAFKDSKTVLYPATRPLSLAPTDWDTTLSKRYREAPFQERYDVDECYHLGSVESLLAKNQYSMDSAYITIMRSRTDI